MLFLYALLCFGNVTNRGQAPVIFQQPASVVAGVGVRAVFSFTSNTPFFNTTRQWYRGDEPLLDATNTTLRIESCTFADAGAYSVIASNQFGVVKSQPAQLLVVPAFRLEHLTTITTPRLPDGRAPQGFAMWVKTAGSHLYIADRYLQIYDISNPAAPVWLSTYGKFDSQIYSLFPSGGILALTDGSYLQLVDIANPAQPVRVSRVALRTTGNDVVINGNIVYVATSGGLEIFDISDAGNPIRLGEYGPAVAFTVAAQDNTVYLGATSKGVLVIDATDLASPKLITQITGSFVDTVKLEGRRLYTAGDKLAVYDVTNPPNPALLGTPRFLGGGLGSHGMTAEKEFVFTGQSSATVLDRASFSVFDASDPTSLAEVAHYNEQFKDSLVEGVEIDDPFIYVAMGGKVEIFQRLPATNAPVVVRSIGNALSVPGAPARLQVLAAGGGEAMQWQWARDGMDLPGETNRTLALPRVTEQNIGPYSVRVSNYFGSVLALGSLALTEAPSLDLMIPRASRLELRLPDGFQSRLEATSDFSNWQQIWSGQGSTNPITPFDAAGQSSAQRFYRLRFGLE